MMKRGTKFIARTINLSNPESCIRPKRIRKLVEAESLQPCPGDVDSGSSAYWTPRPVPIKICTRKDVQRTCPPKLCDCSQKTPARSVGRRLCAALLFLLKSGVAVGLVYWTNSEGLWGSGADVEDLYRRLMATIAPAFTDDHDGDQIELPRVGEFKYRAIRTYNRAVLAVLTGIVDASMKLQEQCRRVLSQPEKEQQPSDRSTDDEDTG